ncbi:hypothetical protein L2E82_02634 [Cichorium intybus]|uniref:Uncharacterized protein n=1 Tax=Cichorium intybus TaxID=13427 RepID=A0ACB9H3T0_CICIN|nr:hypothetical protein L2E82_02634 [Cichorium intybus]
MVEMVSSPDKRNRTVEDGGMSNYSTNSEKRGFEEQDEDQLIGGPVDLSSPCSVERVIRSEECAGPCSIPDLNSPIPCSEPIKRGQNYVKWNGKKAMMSVKFKDIIKAFNNGKRKSKKAQNCNVSQEESTFSDHSKTSVQNSSNLSEEVRKTIQIGSSIGYQMEGSEDAIRDLLKGEGENIKSK